MTELVRVGLVVLAMVGIGRMGLLAVELAEAYWRPQLVEPAAFDSIELK